MTLQPAPVLGYISDPPSVLPAVSTLGVFVQRENVTTGAPRESVPTEASKGSGLGETGSAAILPAW